MTLKTDGRTATRAAMRRSLKMNRKGLEYGYYKMFKLFFELIAFMFLFWLGYTLIEPMFADYEEQSINNFDRLHSDIQDLLEAVDRSDLRMVQGTSDYYVSPEYPIIMKDDCGDGDCICLFKCKNPGSCSFSRCSKHAYSFHDADLNLEGMNPMIQPIAGKQPKIEVKVEKRLDKKEGEKDYLITISQIG